MDKKKILISLFPWIILFIIVFRILFIITFPLESTSDGFTYLNMIFNGNSSLVHAGGYPWIMNFFHNIGFFNSANALLLLQHLMGIAFLLWMFFYLKKRFGISVSVIAGILLGLDVTILEKASVSRPEWLQGILIALTFITAYEAKLQKIHWKKIYLYTGASIWLILSYLVKFNSLFLLVTLLILILSEKRKKIIYLISIIPLPIILYCLFMYNFHLPSTGTKKITLQKPFLLFYKINSLPNGISQDNGIWSKRYKIIENEVPVTKNLFYFWNIDIMFGHVNAISQEVRKKYGNRFDMLKKMNEEKLKKILLNKHIKQHNIVRKIIDLYYFVGLERINNLGSRVFLETVNSNRLAYLRNVINSFFNSFFLQSKRIFLNIKPGPSKKNENNFLYPGMSREKKYLGKGYYEYDFYTTGNPLRKRYLEPIFWNPGIYIFDKWSKLTPPTTAKWVIVILGMFVIFVKRKNLLRQDENLFIFLCAISFFFFLLGTSLIVEFRWKELRAMEPLFCIWVAISLKQLYNLFRQKLG